MCWNLVPDVTAGGGGTSRRQAREFGPSNRIPQLQFDRRAISCKNFMSRHFVPMRLSDAKLIPLPLLWRC